MTITHEMELLALMGRSAEVIDPHGETLAIGTLLRYFDAGRIVWRVIEWSSLSGKPQAARSQSFELRDIADIAGTVIELRRAR